ncbi:hypothetical protein [Chromobacterium vaccinii]|uniref:hypothetical protein n=1 Tax=Chromobacterium vaccinii TaxID=1108595 RepID=UPI003260C0D1
MSKSFNSLPAAKFDDKYQVINEATGKPVANRKYLVVRAWGEIEKGVTDANGYTHVIKNPDSPEKIKILVL